MITNRQIIDSLETLKKLYGTKIQNIKLSYAIIKNARMVDDALKPYGEAYQKIDAEFLVDETRDGKPARIVPESRIQEYNDKVDALLEMDSGFAPYLMDLEWLQAEIDKNPDFDPLTPAEIGTILFLFKSDN